MQWTEVMNTFKTHFGNNQLKFQEISEKDKRINFKENGIILTDYRNATSLEIWFVQNSWTGPMVRILSNDNNLTEYLKFNKIEELREIAKTYLKYESQSSTEDINDPAQRRSSTEKRNELIKQMEEILKKLKQIT